MKAVKGREFLLSERIDEASVHEYRRLLDIKLSEFKEEWKCLKNL